MGAVEFIPPPRGHCLWKRLFGHTGILLFWTPWDWSIGFEIWRSGAAVNVGPLSLGFARLRPAESPSPQSEAKDDA